MYTKILGDLHVLIYLDKLDEEEIPTIHKTFAFNIMFCLLQVYASVTGRSIKRAIIRAVRYIMRQNLSSMEELLVLPPPYNTFPEFFVHFIYLL